MMSVFVIAFLLMQFMSMGGSLFAYDKKALRGTASWYSQSDRHIKRCTASGEIFDDSKKTCASWRFKFGTRLKVINTKNGKSVVCRVNDRGPARRLKRIVDLSHSAFREIADPRSGLILVSITPMDS